MVRIRQSLFLKMVFCTLLIMALALFTLLTYTYTTNVRILKDRAIEGNRKDLYVISDKIDAYLGMLELVSSFTYEKNVQSLLTRSENESDITRMRRLRRFQDFYYRRLVSLNYDGQIQDLYFIYPDGEILHKGNGIYDKTYDFTKTGWYKEAVNAAGRAIIVDTHHQDYNRPSKYPEWDENSSRYYISVARCVNGADSHTVMGVLMMDIDIGEFTGKIGPLLLGNESQVYFVDACGKILYSRVSEQIGKMLPEHIFSEFQGQASGYLSGSDSVVTWLQSPKTGWYLVNINPTELILSEIQTMKRNAGIMAVVVFILSAVIMTAYTCRIVEPVKRLAWAMRQVEQGDLDITVSHSSGDEIGYLTDAFNRMLERIRNLIKDNYLIRLKEKDAQLASLQLQINPHFLYNTLESVNCIAAVKEVEEIQIISRALANMFRYSIRHWGTKVCIADELDHVRNYIDIQKIRFGNKIYSICEIHESMKGFAVIPLVLQPLVENCIKHTVEAFGQPVHIRIVIEKEGGQISFCVEDDGVGMDPERLDALCSSLKTGESHEGKNAHIGLLNVHNRLRLNYGDSFGLHIESERHQFTRVSFFIPCEDCAPDFQKQRH